jgi:hypothetical protein
MSYPGPTRLILAAKDLRDSVSTKKAFNLNQISDIHPAQKILSVDAETESKIA